MLRSKKMTSTKKSSMKYKNWQNVQIFRQSVKTAGTFVLFEIETLGTARSYRFSITDQFSNVREAIKFGNSLTAFLWKISFVPVEYSSELTRWCARKEPRQTRFRRRDWKIEKRSRKYHSIIFRFCRYLDRYEKVHFLGEDGQQADDEDEDSRHRKWSARALHSVPLNYNYHQHNVAGSCMKHSISIVAPNDQLHHNLHFGIIRNLNMKK